MVPDRGESTYFAPFTRILASRGALSPMVMVAAEIPPGLSLEQWTELPIEETEPAARVFTQRWAGPLVGVSDSMPLVLVAAGTAVGEQWTRTLELFKRWLERSRANTTPALLLGDAGRADLVRLAARFGVPFVPAVDWGSSETVKLAAEAIFSTVERHTAQHAAPLRHSRPVRGTVRWSSPFSVSPAGDDSSADYAAAAAGHVSSRANVVHIQPFGDNILVDAQHEAITPSGLVIPDTAAHPSQTGTVLAVGPGRWDEESDRHIPLGVSEGDTIIFSKYGGTEIKYNGQPILVLGPSDVLAVVNTTGAAEIARRRGNATLEKKIGGSTEMHRK